MNSYEVALDDLIKSINDLPEIKRLHELEVVIDKNVELKDTFKELKETQKRYINSKHYGLINQAELDKNKIDELKNKIEDTPLLSEYMDLLEEAYSMLLSISKIIESELNNHI